MEKINTPGEVVKVISAEFPQFVYGSPNPEFYSPTINAVNFSSSVVEFDEEALLFWLRSLSMPGISGSEERLPVHDRIKHIVCSGYFFSCQ